MPTFCASPRTKLNLHYPVEKVTPSRFSVPCFILIAYKSVLTATDDALRSAAETGNRASSELDEKFVKVINMLDEFDHAFYSEDSLLGQNVDRAVIEAAKRNDMSELSLATLSLHEDAHAKVRFSPASSLLRPTDSRQWPLNGRNQQEPSSFTSLAPFLMPTLLS
jgi:hypothetical protein